MVLSRGCRVHKGSGPGCGGLRFSGLGCWCFGFLGFRFRVLRVCGVSRCLGFIRLYCFCFCLGFVRGDDCGLGLRSFCGFSAWAFGSQGFK